MSKIAIIYEGVKAEKEIFNSIFQKFFSSIKDITIFSFPADGNIYMLWERLKEDEFETDVISVVKEMLNTCKNVDVSGIKASDFSEIYLFFDFDIHNNNLKKEHRNIDVLYSMFDTFCNETENGKLYVSYPMVEAIKDISVQQRDYNNFYITVDESAEYKTIVNSDSDFSNYGKVSRKMWLAACDASRKRASLIVLQKYLSDYKEFLTNITQKKLYEAERDLYVKQNGCIAILNTIPLFLLEYFKEEFWKEAIDEDTLL